LNSAQYLEEIKISNVPKMKSVFIVSSDLRMLETLTIEKCDELKQIIIDTGDHNSTGGNEFGNVFPQFKRFHVENCAQLEYISGYYNHDHQNQTEMAKLQLNEYPPLASSGDFIKVSLFPHIFVVSEYIFNFRNVITILIIYILLVQIGIERHYVA